MKLKWKTPSPGRQIFTAVLLVLASCLLRQLLLPGFGRGIPYLTYYPAVILAATYGGLRAGLLASALSAALSFYWTQQGHLSGVEVIAFAVFLLICLMISFSSGALHQAWRKSESTQEKLKVELAERKRVEEALRNSNERLRLATQASAVGIWQWNTGTNQIQWSDQMFRLYGIAPAPGGMVDYKTWAEAVLPEDLPQQEEILQKTVLDRGSSRREFRIRRANDGEIRHLQSVEIVLGNSQGDAEWVLGTNLDLTESRQVEESLRQVMRFSQATIDSLSAHVCVLDSNGMILSTNQAWNDFADANPPRAQRVQPGANYLEVCEQASTPDAAEAKAFAAGIRSVISGERPFYSQEYACHSPTEERWFVARVTRFKEPAPARVVVAHENITDRKRVEMHLVETLKELQDFKVALDEHAIVSSTNAEGEITYVNEKFCQLTQFSREELLGRNHRIINSGFHSKDFFSDLWATILQGRTWKGEVKNRAKDGTLWWMDTTVVPFLNADGKPFQFVAIRTDITKLKQREAEIRELNARLETRIRERTSQLETTNRELEAFCYSVSHDLRAPLRSIDGFSRILLEDYQDKLDESGKDSLGRVRLAAQRMGVLIDDLLTLSRLTRAEIRMEAVDLSAMATQVLNGLQQEEPGRRVETVVEPGLVALADPILIRSVLENLLGNAWKYSSKKTAARIEFGALGSRDGVPILPGEAGAGTALMKTFFVRDNGAGFDMAYVDKLFGAFQRLHSPAEFPGSGVGLATVQRILHRHHGQAWAEGQLNRGATFYFTLPEPT